MWHSYIEYNKTQLGVISQNNTKTNQSDQLHKFYHVSKNFRLTFHKVILPFTLFKPLISLSLREKPRVLFPILIRELHCPFSIPLVYFHVHCPLLPRSCQPVFSNTSSANAFFSKSSTSPLGPNPPLFMPVQSHHIAPRTYLNNPLVPKPCHSLYIYLLRYLYVFSLFLTLKCGFCPQFTKIALIKPMCM